MGIIAREIAAVLILLSASSTALGGVCEESILMNRYIISCRSKDLAAVPDLSRYDKEYDELTLAQNQIARIEDAAFSGLRIKNLDLRYNPIVFVSPIAFQDLGQVLETLLISFYQTLTEFPSLSLQQLPGLKTLTIDAHGFVSLPDDALQGFQGLSSLAFTGGLLTNLTVEFFQRQQDTLTNLDLQSNQFSGVPTQALAQLRSLRHLNLATNRISRLDADSFRGLFLELLDLSTQNQPVSVVDEYAFRGLETSLKNLSMASLSLTNQNVRALKHLTGVIDLDLSRNRITRLEGLFVSLRSLVRLNLQDNPITVLGSAVFADAGSIRVLNLAYNNISNMDPEAFVGLTSLEDLDLGYSNDLTLDDESFRAQRNTLKFLKLHSANLRSTQWTAITKLYELQDLFLSRCGLRNIPDYTFQEMRKLRSIDLRNNEIQTIGQRSLSGLENTLEILNLLGNQIRTIDGCVFRGFTRLNLFQLSLQQNPLQCVCDLNWLRLWVLNVTGNDGYQKGRISWTCDDLGGGAFFRDLTDAHYAECLTTEAPCEDMSSRYTTDPTGGGPNGRPTIVSLQAVSLTSDSVELQWEVSVNDSAGFSLTCDTDDGTPTAYVDLGSEVRAYQVERLKPDTRYRMCLAIRGSDAISCLNVTTTTTSAQPLNLMLIYGASIGAGVAIIVLVLLIIVCCCVSASSNRKKHAIVQLEQPKVGNETKRFQKPQTLDPEPMSRTKSIAEQLESLTDEERYRLVNLLTHSGGSIASLDFSVHSLPRQRPPGYCATLPAVPCGQPRYVPEPQMSKYRYEDVPIDDDYYEEISVDEIV